MSGWCRSSTRRFRKPLPACTKLCYQAIMSVFCLFWHIFISLILYEGFNLQSGPANFILMYVKQLGRTCYREEARKGAGHKSNYLSSKGKNPLHFQCLALNQLMELCHMLTNSITNYWYNKINVKKLTSINKSI